MGGAGQDRLVIEPGSSVRRPALLLSCAAAACSCLALSLAWRLETVFSRQPAWVVAWAWLLFAIGVAAMLHMAWSFYKRAAVAGEVRLRVSVSGGCVLEGRDSKKIFEHWSAQVSAACVSLRLENAQEAHRVAIWRDALSPAEWRSLCMMAVRRQAYPEAPLPGGAA